MAADDLTTLQAVKNWLALGANPTPSDGTLSALVTATSADFLRAIDRFDFLAATYTEIREGDGGPRLSLRHWPVNAVTALTIGGTAVAPSPDSIQAGYVIVQQPDPERLRDLFMVGGAVFADLAVISVTYSGGYAAVPADVAQAVLDWVVLRWRSVPGIGVSSARDAGGEHVTYDREAAMPATTQAVADRYKRTWPVLDKRQDDRDYRVTRITKTYTTTEKAR